MQDYVNQNVGIGKTYDFYEKRSGIENHGYTDQAFPPIISSKMWKVFYYDNYDFDNNGQMDINFNSTFFPSQNYIDPLPEYESYHEIIAVQNEYNEIGQLNKRKFHSTNNGTNFTQALDYKYHIQGWLKGINDLWNMGSDCI